MTPTSIDLAACTPFTNEMQINYFLCLVLSQLLFWLHRKKIFTLLLSRQRWFKNTVEWFPQKYSHHCLIKNIHNWDNNIYEANKKPGSRFETCCPLIFLNECLSIYKLQLISNNYHAVWVTFFHMTFGCIPCLMRTSPESCMW